MRCFLPTSVKTIRTNRGIIININSFFFGFSADKTRNRKENIQNWIKEALSEEIKIERPKKTKIIVANKRLLFIRTKNKIEIKIGIIFER